MFHQQNNNTRCKVQNRDYILSYTSKINIRLENNRNKKKEEENTKKMNFPLKTVPGRVTIVSAYLGEIILPKGGGTRGQWGVTVHGPRVKRLCEPVYAQINTVLLKPFVACKKRIPPHC